jgi:hypothetical protein
MLAALVAVLALGVVASASASAALPEIVPGAGVKFPIAVEGASRNVAKVHLSQRNGSEPARCEGVKFKGDITGAKAVSLTTEMTYCTQDEPTRKCSTAGAAAGHVVLAGTGTLAYINKASKVVGIVLTLPETEVECGGYAMLVKGSVIIPITPINTKTSELSMVIKESEIGKQEYTTYENEKGEVTTAYLRANLDDGWEVIGFSVAEPVKLTDGSKSYTISA